MRAVIRPPARSPERGPGPGLPAADRGGGLEPGRHLKRRRQQRRQSAAVDDLFPRKATGDLRWRGYRELARSNPLAAAEHSMDHIDDRVRDPCVLQEISCRLPIVPKHDSPFAHNIRPATSA